MPSHSEQGTSARLVPATARSWRAWSDVEDVFTGPADPTWDHDRDLVDGEITGPRAPR
ncbi:hypothetical protein [Kineococcus glutinatus]|uniref:Uncharacterized protein n=1 Tax=Kineococcus glutinatus TaxID=1070872 RepID=A0ABP9HY29_9ACTN